MNPELTILMPCLDEARTVGICVAKAIAFLECNGIDGEVVVADNGSRDGSQAIAKQAGARVVDVSVRGYGAALIAGIGEARGQFVIMGDSDDSYDFSALMPFVEALRNGHDLVVGNRFRGEIRSGAMPLLHRYLGNPVLTTVGRLFFGSPCGDFHCGLRGFRRSAILSLDLQAPGMEFASEMIVKATVAGLRIGEVPTTLSPDGRGRPPHLRSWRDGWRHLRFLLLFSPRWLFLYPGLALSLAGLAGMLLLSSSPRTIGDVTIDIHTLAYCAVMVSVGAQAILFWIFARMYGEHAGIVPADPIFRGLVTWLSVERCLIGAAGLLVAGLGLGAHAFGIWGTFGFGAISAQHTMRFVIPSCAAIVLSFQIGFAGFFMAILRIRKGSPATPEQSLDDATPARVAHRTT